MGEINDPNSPFTQAADAASGAVETPTDIDRLDRYKVKPELIAQRVNEALIAGNEEAFDVYRAHMETMASETIGKSSALSEIDTADFIKDIVAQGPLRRGRDRGED